MLDITGQQRALNTSETCAGLADTSVAYTGWHVIWTRSNCEKNVMEQLAAHRYEIFLPMITQRTPPGRKLPARRTPMFRSYLFVRHQIDKKAWLDISNTKGVVSILGTRWDKLARIPDEEIDSIKLLMESRLPTMPHPWLEVGTPVRITRGSLANARGILVDSEMPNGLFVVSINLLQRSVAVKVDCADVEQV